jgi:hypothetical protein
MVAAPLAAETEPSVDHPLRPLEKSPLENAAAAASAPARKTTKMLGVWRLVMAA